MINVKNIGEDELMLRVPRWTGPEQQWSVRSSLKAEYVKKEIIKCSDFISIENLFIVFNITE